jgi:prophage DNA circulation protein
MARDDVRPASFRGVAFTVTSVETSGLARRVEVHQFPFRDDPYAEDFGQQARTYSLECFVSWARRAALEQACKAPGPGPLVHPFLGTLNVVCVDCSSKDSTSSAGLTFYSLTFRDAGVNKFPTATPNTGAAVDSAAEFARLSSQSTFVGHFDQPVPQWVTNASVDRVEDLGEEIDAASRLVHGGEGLAAFHLLRRTLDDAAALVANPSLLASRISETIQALAGLSLDPLETLRALETLASDFGSTFDVITGTGSRAAEAERQNAVVRIARRSALVEATVAARSVPLDSYDAASALRSRMVDLFDGELDAAGDDDDALAALEALRSKLLDDLRARGGALATVRTLTLASSVPAVLLAYRLYADPERDAELVARNRIRHPGFVPAAVPLEVLSA